MEKQKGYIIVIDGTDGCGKQTQAQVLLRRLLEAGYDVKLQSFPNYDSQSSGPVKMYLGGEFGDVNSLDPYQASSLYAVDRLCTYNKHLKDFYENGGILILDRYTQANMIHQAGKLSNKSEVDKLLEWLNDFEFGTLKLPKPDRVFFLDVPIEVSLKLMEERGIHKTGTAKDVHEQDPNHLKHAYNAGKYVGEKFGWDMINCVDNGKLKSIEEISELIWSRVKDDLESVKEL
ncbi:MAG: dTMP kinase [Christensenellales bacterium]